jgi:hypothetical protein
MLRLKAGFPVRRHAPSAVLRGWWHLAPGIAPDGRAVPTRQALRAVWHPHPLTAPSRDCLLLLATSCSPFHLQTPPPLILALLTPAPLTPATSWPPLPQGSGLSWLFPFVDGAPPIGWHDAGAYLILPVLLVISQWASQKIVSPKTDDPAQQQTQAILQFIPFMIGARRGRCCLGHVLRGRLAGGQGKRLWVPAVGCSPQ